MGLFGFGKKKRQSEEAAEAAAEENDKADEAISETAEAPAGGIQETILPEPSDEYDGRGDEHGPWDVDDENVPDYDEYLDMGAVSGLLAVGICLIWAWNSHEARNYYMFGFLTNAFYIVLLAISLMVRVPGLGLVIEFIRTLPTEHLRAWLADWRGDKALNRAYTIITALWIGVFSLRLVVQVPLYLSNQVGWLGTARLLMGIPFWALAIWVSYLLSLIHI